MNDYKETYDYMSLSFAIFNSFYSTEDTIPKDVLNVILESSSGNI